MKPINHIHSLKSPQRIFYNLLFFSDDHRKQRVKKGMQRLKDKPAMADNKIILKDKKDKNWQEDVWFRRNRSKVYLYLVPLISIFYFVPAIQFAFQAKETEELTGSMDLCYHNFKCARPWFIFSDFNHVISNISYVIFGLIFMPLCFLKTKQLPGMILIFSNFKFDYSIYFSPITSMWWRKRSLSILYLS